MKNIFRKYVVFRIICCIYTNTYKIKNMFGYKKALIRTFHTSFLLIHNNDSTNSKSNFILKNQFIKVCFKDFWYTQKYSQKYILYSLFLLIIFVYQKSKIHITIYNSITFLKNIFLLSLSFWCDKNIHTYNNKMSRIVKKKIF